jgi:hypothetical protein
MVLVALLLPPHCVMDVVLVGHADHFEVGPAEDFAIDHFEEGVGCVVETRLPWFVLHHGSLL